ncbi:MAG: DNA repair protein RadA, partial [Ectothiorhodospira sp.]
MAKPRIRYQCTACGSISPKWIGQCPDCGAWNSMEEAVEAPSPAGGGRFAGYTGGPARVQRLGDVQGSDQARLSTGISELDRALGGGLV